MSGQGSITEIIDCTGDCTGPGTGIDLIDCLSPDNPGNGLRRPEGIAVDGAGNVYVVGTGSANAFKITPAGVITEIIDAFDDAAGFRLNAPNAIAVDGTGNVYVAGGGIFKITPDGLFTSLGVGGSGIALDAAGNVYVVDGDRAFKITPAGVITQIIDKFGDGAGNYLGDGLVISGNGNSIAVDGAGNVYVTGFSSNNAFKITPDGVITQIIDGTGDGADNGFSSPAGIAVDAAGNVYVLGGSLPGGNAFKITPAGVITKIIDCTGDGTGHCFIGGPGNGLISPRDIAVDTAGNVYVTGSVSGNAFKISPAGVSSESPDTDAGDGNTDMAPTMDDEPSGARATPAMCGVAMIGTFFMTLLGLVSLSSAYRHGHILRRR